MTVRVTVTVPRTVVMVVGLLGSKTREEVKGPWAAATRLRARVKRRESRVGMAEGVGGEKERRSGQRKQNIC